MKPAMRKLLAGMALGLVTTSAGAQYPARPVRFIVPFPPGGPTDVVARVVGERLSNALGQPVVVDNRAGAGGTVGADVAAKSLPDGYTILLATTGTLVTAPLLQPGITYDPVRSFAPVSRLTNATFVVATHATVAAASLRDLIALAKASPGQLAFGSAGNGHPLHIAGEMFKQAASVNLLHVPYKGAAPAVTDLVAGRIQLMFEQPAAFRGHKESGSVKFLAVAGRERLAQFPDVPTAAEAGLPGYELSVWFAMVAPAGTALPIIERLNAETQKALAQAEIRATFEKMGLQAAGSSPEGLASLIAEDTARWGRAIKASGIRLD